MSSPGEELELTGEEDVQDLPDVGSERDLVIRRHAIAIVACGRHEKPQTTPNTQSVKLTGPRRAAMDLAGYRNGGGGREAEEG